MPNRIEKSDMHMDIYLNRIMYMYVQCTHNIVIVGEPKQRCPLTLTPDFRLADCHLKFIDEPQAHLIPSDHPILGA
jgi:hypothetical protein